MRGQPELLEIAKSHLKVKYLSKKTGQPSKVPDSTHGDQRLARPVHWLPGRMAAMTLAPAQQSDGNTLTIRAGAQITASAKYAGSSVFRIADSSNGTKQASAQMAKCSILCCIRLSGSNSPCAQTLSALMAGHHSQSPPLFTRGA